MSKVRRFNIILGVTNAVLIAVCAALLGMIHSLGVKYSSDSAKKAWDGGKYTYSQVSLFIPPEKSFDLMGVYTLRKSIEEKLKESSILGAEDNPAGRLWIDCAAGDVPLTAEGNYGKCTAETVGTYGDYFIFHPEKLICGSYYTSDDINMDRVVLDRQCSWQLFGATDTVGLPVNIGGKVYYVSAVIETPEGKTEETAYGIKPRLYMPYESLKELDGSLCVNSYEVCIPNAVKDYGYTVVKDVNPAGESAVIVDQSGRFGLIKLIKGAGEIPESVMVKSGMAMPWHENLVRSAELRARILAAPLPYLMLIPAFSLVYCIFALVKLMGRGVRAIGGKAEERYQKRISEEYYKNRNKA